MAGDDDGAQSRHARWLVDALRTPLALVGHDGAVLSVNQAWRSMAVEGRADEASTCVGANYLDVCHRAARAGSTDGAVVGGGLQAVLSGDVPVFAHDYPCPGPDGAPRWFEVTVTAVPEAGCVAVLHSDVTERVHSERSSSALARQDQLTGLANRLRILEVLEDALRRSTDTAPVTIAFLDIDLFKSVNDSLGHSAGDLLLMEIASRLERCVPANGLLGRLGGDEFIVIAPDCDADDGIALAQRLRAAAAQPFEVAGTQLPVSVSIGLATAAPHQRPGDLLRDADAALYAAKEAGRDRAHAFTPDLHVRANERLVLLTGLRRALQRSELVLDYQPVVDLEHDVVAGFEALMRWQDPDRGRRTPADFIPLAEESGLIVPMGRWLLAEAATQAVHWCAEGLRGKVGVNISARHLAAGTLLEDVLDALAVAGLSPGHLLVEITETAVARETSTTVQQLAALREHGVFVTLDDFGAGYSSFGQLLRLPADTVKLDRSLLPAGDGSEHSRRAEALARAVVTAAHELGLQVVAEGVETAEELAVVRALGCHFAQGYLFGRPAPAQHWADVVASVPAPHLWAVPPAPRRSDA